MTHQRVLVWNTNFIIIQIFFYFLDAFIHIVRLVTILYFYNQLLWAIIWNKTRKSQSKNIRTTSSSSLSYNVTIFSMFILKTNLYDCVLKNLQVWNQRKTIITKKQNFSLKKILFFHNTISIKIFIDFLYFPSFFPILVLINRLQIQEDYGFKTCKSKEQE